MQTNVLVLSAGRRVELVQSFQQDLLALIENGKVFCTDMNPLASSACQVSDGAFAVPRVTHDDYIDIIFALCIDHNIGLVIPTIDTELALLSQHKAKFASSGIHLLISSETLIQECRDKRLTAALFDRLDVAQPKILDKSNLTFPCFCKPYDGSCSQGAYPLLQASDLTADMVNNPKNMFMELVPKTYCEYTIDGYYTKNGELKCLVPRKRIEVRGGEVSKGLTKKHFVYDYLLTRVSTLEGACGCITFQLFVNEETQSIRGLEINPRFGGGYPLAYSAGATFPKWLIMEYLLGQDIPFYDEWRQNLLMLRYDAKVLVDDYQE